MGDSDELSQLRARVAELESSLASRPEALRQLKRLRMLFQESADALIVFAPETEGAQLIEFNQAACTILRMTADELRAKTCFELLAPGDLEATPLLGSALSPGTAGTVERQMVRGDGSIFPALARASGLSDGNIIVSIRDLTAEQNAEDAPGTSKAHLTMLFNDAMDAILVTENDDGDGEGKIIQFNEPALALLGRTNEQMKGLKYREIIDPEDWARRPPDRAALLGEGIVSAGRLLVKPNGDRVPVNVRLKNMRDGTNMLVLQDLSEREAAEAAIRDRDARLLMLAEQSPDAVLMHRQGEGIMEFNAAAAAMLGYAPEELYGRDYNSLVRPGSGDDVQSDNARVRAAETVSSIRELVRKDGQIITVDARAKLLPDGRSLVVLRDVTEQLRLEEQLQQSQRMESIGQLTGGVAHEFNNLLSVINGYAEMTLPLVAEHPEAHRNVEDIHTAGLKAAELTRQLMDVGQRQMVASQELNLNALIRDLGRMLSHVIGPGIQLSTELDPLLPYIHADAAQIEHVVVNLTMNAGDAMPDGGRLRIKTKSARDQDDRPTVTIAIQDDGVGMNEQIQRQAFDPFFTTKDQGQGIGLGLATTYGIVKQAGGTIEVESAPGEGSTFTVIFPEANKAQTGDSR